jgi:thiosulfate/3-mercaptopyruvate sulfurtransferase
MKQYSHLIFLPLLIVVFLFPGTTWGREIEPIVQVKWLEANLAHPKLVILDIRHVEEYREGHIPGSLNSFYGGWAYKKGELYSEIPEPDDLEDLIGSLGLNLNSWVVVVGKSDTPRDCYQSTRVVCTLQYAGMENVALLDGGINQWIKYRKPLSTEPVSFNSKPFKGKFNRDKFADKDYILSRMGKIILLDVREAPFFKGERKLDCIARPGHIPGAFNLPTSCAYNKDGTFKNKGELSKLAESVAGKDKTKAIVTYCDIGQCCPTWVYILKEVLGYKEVRMYDGAMQEWMQDPGRPVER